MQLPDDSGTEIKQMFEKHAAKQKRTCICTFVLNAASWGGELRLIVQVGIVLLSTTFERFEQVVLNKLYFDCKGVILFLPSRREVHVLRTYVARNLG